MAVLSPLLDAVTLTFSVVATVTLTVSVVATVTVFFAIVPLAASVFSFNTFNFITAAVAVSSAVVAIAVTVVAIITVVAVVSTVVAIVAIPIANAQCNVAACAEEVSARDTIVALHDVIAIQIEGSSGGSHIGGILRSAWSWVSITEFVGFATLASFLVTGSVSSEDKLSVSVRKIADVRDRFVNNDLRRVPKITIVVVIVTFIVNAFFVDVVFKLQYGLLCTASSTSRIGSTTCKLPNPLILNTRGGVCVVADLHAGITTVVASSSTVGVAQVHGWFFWRGW
mmetsp:Transcript_8622/g.14335  ORF Transcript_8622/g.14335 Transcript_8622/m.14335 type:complete len:283 (-) Transcript_8622:334-1182(-)